MLRVRALCQVVVSRTQSWWRIISRQGPTSLPLLSAARGSDNPATIDKLARDNIKRLCEFTNSILI
jgi:hypothetical protein